jgi:hypothetical protein
LISSALTKLWNNIRLSRTNKKQKTKALLLLQILFVLSPRLMRCSAVEIAENPNGFKLKETRNMNICRHLMQSKGPSRKYASERCDLWWLGLKAKRKPGSLPPSASPNDLDSEVGDLLPCNNLDVQSNLMP